VSSLPVRLLAASLATAFALLALDLAVRRAAPAALLVDHALPSVVLLGAWCAALAGAIAITTWLLGLAGRALARHTRAAPVVVVVVGGMLFAASLLDTARWAFVGARAREGWMGTWGPVLALGAAALAGAVAAALARWAELAARAGRKLPAAVVASAFVAGAVVLVAIDRTAYVGLYERIHRALDFVATLLAIVAVALALGPATARLRLARGAVWFASRGAAILLLAVVASPRERLDLERALAHVGADPGVVGRTVARLETFESIARGDGGELRMSGARIDALLERWGVPGVARDPRWDEPFREPPVVAAAAEQFRDDERAPSVVVFYVDTLRRDVAFDPDVMPNVTEFARGAMRFDRAYTAGSDTLTALPAILGGHYDLRRIDDPEPDGDDDARGGGDAARATGSLERDTVLDVARDQGVPTTLFIAESAWEFLDKLLPTFHFDHVERVRDYEKAGVWGYGADGATSEEVVVRALDWMHERKDKGRFFSWIFQFDVHNWRELDGRFIASAAQRFGMTDDGSRQFRYRVAARAVDESFGRLLDGLRAMELEDDVVVLFVSDHGEALGYEDFWVHSVFLWEPLVRVPLVLRAPGLPPSVVDEQVSLVDVAPTLARYLHPAPSMIGYHGEDLVTYALPDRPKRRLPLLLASVNEQRLSRVGLVDGRYKLVLRTDWGEPQLYDLAARDPDAEDVAAQHDEEVAARMSQLLRSPVFVNAYLDAKALEAKDAR
jgi:arylsulfatase A-like enzyme